MRDHRRELNIDGTAFSVNTTMCCSDRASQADGQAQRRRRRSRHAEAVSGPIAFSSEVDAGSRQENASKQETRARF
jgi:hypothetical protein